MATQNGSTLATLGTAWRGRSGAPANELRVLKNQTDLQLSTNGNGSTKAFTVAHSLSTYPTVVVMESQHTDSNATHTVTADGTNVTVTFATAPQAGTNNVHFHGSAAY